MPEFPEYEYEEVPIPEVVRSYEAWLNKLAVGEPGLTVGDFDAMFQVWYFRMRSIYTTENLVTRLRALMAQAEHMLAQPGFLEDELGNKSSPILRENFADTPDEDYHKMLAEQYTVVTDEEINDLLDGEGEEE